MSRFNLAVVTNLGEVFLSSPCTVQGMYNNLRWLVRYGRCESFKVYICRCPYGSFSSECKDVLFDECFFEYPFFSVVVVNGVEEMTENFRKRICGI